jgi:hypothetical protein
MGLAAIAVLAAPAGAQAATFPVTSNGDQSAGGAVTDGICTTDANPAIPNDCTLRAAIEEANGTVGPDTISFPPPVPATITLNGSQLPPISGTLTITGPGASALTVSGNLASRVFETAGASNTTISGLTIADGFVAGSKGADGNIAVGDPGGDARGAGILSAGTLSLTGVTVRDNRAVGGLGGDGDDGLAVSDGFDGGPGGIASGGGVFNTGTLAVVGSAFNGNRAEGGSGGTGGPHGGLPGDESGRGGAGNNGRGGAIANEIGATLTIQNSTLQNNEVIGGVGGKGGDTAIQHAGPGGAGGWGLGGAVSSSGQVTITGSTLSDNEAEGFFGGDGGTAQAPGSPGGPGAFGNGIGAGIQQQGTQTLTITNSTVSGNLASTDPADSGIGFGGGIATGDTAPLIATHVTLVDNEADAGSNLGTVNGVATLRATIIASRAGTPAPSNCSLSLPAISLGFNLDDGTSCGFGPVPGTDLEGVEPQLAALANNGGPTQTHLPLGTSPVIDKVTAGCPPPAADQRGTTRAKGAGCEIGAVELTATEIDADGDGIPNNIDTCPAAAANTPNGCPEAGAGADTTDPETTITKKPKKKSRKKKVAVQFSSTEAGSTFTCQVNKKPPVPCASGFKAKSKKGKNTLLITATDAAGNVDDTPATAKWRFVP